MKNKTGRPPRSKEAAKHVIAFKVTSEELRFLKKKGEEHHCSKGVYSRSKALEGLEEAEK